MQAHHSQPGSRAFSSNEEDVCQRSKRFCLLFGICVSQIIMPCWLRLKHGALIIHTLPHASKGPISEPGVRLCHPTMTIHPSILRVLAG
jgi:hypothetical protein